MDNIARVILLSFAVVKFMMIINSLEIPLHALELIKKTDSDKEKMFIAKAGMFFDCPVCISVIASLFVFLIEIIGLGFVNSVLGFSVIGVIINKKFIS